MTRLPRRTCIGCRKVDDAAALVRLARVDGAVVPDSLHRLPGRGAWIHAAAECVTAAGRRRAWGRAFRHPGPLDVSAVLALVEPRV